MRVSAKDLGVEKCGYVLAGEGRYSNKDPFEQEDLQIVWEQTVETNMWAE